MLTNIENTKRTYSQLTDEELVERSRNGDSQALDVLIRIYLPKAHRKVRSLVPESDVEDVRQEIFLSFIKSIANFKHRSNFSAWFARITMRRIADYYRQKSRRMDDPTEDLPTEVDDPWKKIDDELTVRRALLEMPEKYAEVLLLMFSEGLSLGDVSERLSLTYEATRSRYRRGVNMLKERLMDTSEEYSVPDSHGLQREVELREPEYARTHASISA
jgi:RNA polymerase sigma-70 factor (ECF subfamily)